MTRISAVIITLLMSLAAWAQQPDSTANQTTDRYTKFRFGGYGEILYQHMDYGPDRYNYTDGAQPDSRAVADVPRLIFSVEYKFRKDIEFCSEVEFEHGGTGSALELEYEEMGEYEMEMEKAGEVVLEQFHITKTFNPAFKLRIGHMIVPVGQTNTRHMPIEFFGSVRPEGENNLLPLTWHETGIAILGKYRRWSYELQLVNGLDANGFSSAYWVSLGKQSIFETTKMTDPAVVLRIENQPMRHLRIGLSGYRGNSARNTAKPSKMEHIKGTVSIGSFDFEYKAPNLMCRGNALYGNLTDSYEISKINKSISKNIQYPRTPVASNALTYALEAGYNVLALWPTPQKEKLFVFGRYEYYNAMQQTDARVFADARYQRNVLTAGLNYFVMPNMALKLDYSRRIIDGGKYNNENTIGLALVYAGWFVSK